MRFPRSESAGPTGRRRKSWRWADLWFTENQTDKIGCISSTTHQTHEYDLPQGFHPWGITVGTDGWLWIAETVANSLAAYLPPGPCTKQPGGVGIVKARIRTTRRHGSSAHPLILFDEAFNHY